MEDKPKSNYRLVGINLGVMVFYTLFCKLTSGNDGFIYTAALIVIHIAVCLISAIAGAFIDDYRKSAGMWLLSALAILLIGFSTCIAAFSVKI